MEQALKFRRQTDVWSWNYSRKYLNFTRKSRSVKISNIVWHAKISLAWKKHANFEENLVPGFEIFTKTVEFQIKTGEVFEFPISVHDLVQSTRRYCKKLS